MTCIRKGKLAVSVSTKSITVASVGKTLVEMPSSTAGATVLLDITGFTETFAFDTTFNLAGCGITETVDWGSAMPWFIYLLNGTNATAGVELVMSRNPIMSVAPAEGLFHYSDAAADTDSQLSVLLAKADGTDYSGKPVCLVGACTMTYATSDDDWTPSLATVGGCTEDALRDACSTEYTMASGQNGAVADNGGGGYYYLSTDTNKPPYWTTPANVTYKYTINREGRIGIHYCTRGAGDCIDTGTGNQTLSLRLPYTATYSGSVAQFIPAGKVLTGGISAHLSVNITSSDPSCAINGNLTGIGFKADDFDNANDDIQAVFIYKAF